MVDLYDENVKELCMAIIERACKDYEHALKHDRYSEIFLIEKWFKGSTFDLYSLGKISSDKIMREIQRKVKEDQDRIIKRRRFYNDAKLRRDNSK